MVRRAGAKKTDYKALAAGRLAKTTSFFSTSAYQSKKKVKPTKAPSAAEKAKDKGKSYSDLVVEAIRATAKPIKGASLLAIIAYLAKQHPGKAVRHHIRHALLAGVGSGLLKKHKASYRLAPGVGTKKRASKAKAKSTTATTATTKAKKATKKRKTGVKKTAAAAAAKPKKAGAAKRGAAAAAAAAPTTAAAATTTTTATTTAAKRGASLTKRASSLSAGKKAKVFDSSTKAPEVGDIIWEYQHGTWKTYDKAASDVLEAAYQEWKQNPYTDVRAVKSGQWEYQVDFTNMLQTNIQHEAHTQRKIRRHVLGGEKE